MPAGKGYGKKLNLSKTVSKFDFSKKGVKKSKDTVSKYDFSKK